MNTWQRIIDRLRREWGMAGRLGRLAMVAAPLLLATTLLLAGVVGAGYYQYVTFGQSGGALEWPTAAPPDSRRATPTPEPTSSHPERVGGITRHPATATPDG